MSLSAVKKCTILCSDLALLLCPQLQSETIAIAVGNSLDVSPSVIALIDSTGVPTVPTGDPLPSVNQWISSVAINNQGNAIVGGRGPTSYLSLINSSGALIPITGAGSPPSGPNGSINCVAINNVGNAIAGGSDFNGTPYLSLIDSQGVAKSLANQIAGSRSINAVAINEKGTAIVAGSGVNASQETVLYIGLINSSGSISIPIPSPAEINASPSSVAINETGAAIVGGSYGVSPFNAYIGVIDSSGNLSSPAGAQPFGPGENVQIFSVAINKTGNMVVGGSDSAGPYIGLIDSSSTFTSIFGEVPTSGGGAIQSVAISDSGRAIVGGNNAYAYIGLIDPLGNVTHPTGDFLTNQYGQISSVAINNADSMIVGGHGYLDFAAVPYLALISPTGVATQITDPMLTENMIITSVAIKNILDSVVPDQFGTGGSYASSLFTLSSQVLSNHLTKRNLARRGRAGSSSQKMTEIGLLVDASGKIPGNSHCCKQVKKEPRFALWTTPFGSFAEQKKVQQFPAVKSWSTGALLGIDYLEMPNSLLGAGVAYAYDYFAAGQNGHSQVNQEFATLYGSWGKGHFQLNTSLWGGLYQMDNVRHSVAPITSTSNVEGWLLSPQLEINTPFQSKCNRFTIDPFAMVDWANNWQGHIQEKGASGFNLQIGHQYTSLLRSEVGLRLQEKISYPWGTILLLEKGSYVNKKPFHTGSTTATFVGSGSSFAIETFSNEVQNLGVAQVNVEILPANEKYPYASVNYQGEFGSSFFSNTVNLELGMKF